LAHLRADGLALRDTLVAHRLGRRFDLLAVKGLKEPVPHLVRARARAWARVRVRVGAGAGARVGVRVGVRV
jgi:hypothetical protein